MLNTSILNELLLKKTLSTLSYRPKAMIGYPIPEHCEQISTFLSPFILEGTAEPSKHI
jgi:hypothetical protein